MYTAVPSPELSPRRLSVARLWTALGVVPHDAIEYNVRVLEVGRGWVRGAQPANWRKANFGTPTRFLGKCER